jgi:hypothetical protein
MADMPQWHLHYPLYLRIGNTWPSYTVYQLSTGLGLVYVGILPHFRVLGYSQKQFKSLQLSRLINNKEMNMVKFITHLLQIICIFADTHCSGAAWIATAVGIQIALKPTFVNFLSLA